ncbi:MAG: hypothetical protein GOU98_01770 [Candidatus Altiarchaeota archaeon]|nr:hypothetical protein [Candidatus Altiarchaeota archaeon]
MGGQLIVFYQGTEPEHFLKGIFEFPQVLPVLGERNEELKKLAEEKNRSVIFMGPDEAKMFFNPNFVFHYSSRGGEPEDLAVKLKQDFSVMLFFGKKMGESVSLSKNLDAATAAPILVYEVLNLLRSF